ncbi:hypothetical protein AYI68_g4994 [Smittium mucronatum]|uniref:Uncharacterized protein n=1 Tax=Smittium mucronatum TaxID=133383 RepID=A0A1R0GVI5_9FUNG|nr:hypothetical protein AYI68_g4994 [Smittium mucronatum]
MLNNKYKIRRIRSTAKRKEKKEYQHNLLQAKRRLQQPAPPSTLSFDSLSKVVFNNITQKTIETGLNIAENSPTSPTLPIPSSGLLKAIYESISESENSTKVGSSLIDSLDPSVIFALGNYKPPFIIVLRL